MNPFHDLHSPHRFLFLLCFLLFLNLNMLFCMYIFHTVFLILFISVICVKNM